MTAELDGAVSSAPKERARRQTAVAVVLDWLAAYPGTTWQQRWVATGANTAGAAWPDLAAIVPTNLTRRAQLTGGVARLLLVGVLRPSYEWLYRFPAYGLRAFAERRDPEGFAVLDRLCDDTDRFTSRDRNFAVNQLVRILIHNGGRLADITVADCIEAYRAQVSGAARQHAHWYLLLRQAGILPADSPPTVWAASRRGQLTVEELVDGYDVQCRPVRDLLVDYLHERQAALDYTSLRQLGSKLAMLFWRDLELHEPGIQSLSLTDAVARRWKERLRHIQYDPRRVGVLRQDPNTILMSVRSFYADINQWALEDPSRWGQWAARNPITGRDLLGQNKMQHQRRARMHQRTRELAPILPALVAAAAQRKTHARDLRAAATAVAPGEPFECYGQSLIRSSLASDSQRGGIGRPGLIYADDPATDRRRNLTIEEDDAFWAWAIIEVLRHTGVRLEELLEITHRSFVAYTLPSTGEVIPLLQITPSKTDRERLLVVSPELGEVLTAIIKRVSDGRDTIPLISRYDGPERLHTPPLPFLFQRRWGLRHHAILIPAGQDGH